MPRHKSLVVSAEVVVAGRRRKCYHSSEHTILKGERCLVVKDKMAKKGYCRQCAATMLQNADREIAEICNTLSVELAIPADESD